MYSFNFLPLRDSLFQDFSKTPFLAIVIAFFAFSVTANAATIGVPAGGDFQAALNAANCGDTIVLQGGASYVISALEQPFVAKAKGVCTGTSADFITIQGSNNAALPPSFRDLFPAQINALSLPKLVTKVSTPALEFQAGSHHYRFVGIEITNDSQNQTQLNNGLIFVGENSGSQLQITLANVPHDIEFDRCYVHAEGTDGTTSEYSTAIRGFLVSAKALTIKDCRIAGFRTFWKPGQTNPLSSNAVLITKGPGPYNIVNNYMEAWFGTIFTGGGPQWVTNSANIAPGATTTQATLTNVVGNLPAVGDYIAFLAPGMTYSVGVYHGEPYEWGAAKVTSVNGNTITYVPQSSNNVQSAWGTGPGGTPLTAAPSSAGMAVWNGDRPKDILIEHNQFVKEPVSLQAVSSQYGYWPKGHIELKVGLRTTINANTFEGYHLAFVFTSRNQSSQQEGGGKQVWSTIDDTVFTNNWVKAAPGVGQVFAIQLEDETCTVVPGTGVRIENNLFDSGTKVVNIGASRNVSFIHNTFLSNAGTPADADQVVFNYGGPSANFLMRDNIFYNNGYGLNCQLEPYTQASCWPNLGVNGNVVIDNRTAAEKSFQGPLSSIYPSGNYYADNLANVQFADPSVGNWRLSSASSYKGRGTGGSDPGVNMDTLVAALAAEYNPNPSPSATPTPTPTPGPSDILGNSVSRAKRNGQDLSNQLISTNGSTALIGSNGAPMGESATTAIAEFVSEIQQAYAVFNDNRDLYPAAPRIDVALQAAFVAASQAGQAAIQGDLVGVKSYLREAINNLELSYVLIRYGDVSNPIDFASYLVRQQYVDFLNREPDQSGGDFWINQIASCGTDTQCVEVKRINVSAAFFLSIEFQQTGYYVHRLYKSSYGRVPMLQEFLPNNVSIVSGVIVGADGWEARLAGNKQAFVQAWVQRADFQARYAGLTNEQYIGALIANVGVTITAAEQDDLVQDLANGKSRAYVLGKLVENPTFTRGEFNSAFVLMQYFGYLGRDPDSEGFNFWLSKLNQFNGNFVNAEMVKAFLQSTEYRRRFGL